MKELSATQSWWIATVILITVFLATAYVGYYYYEEQVGRGDRLVLEKTALAEELRLTRAGLASTTAALMIANNQNNIFAGQIGEIASTVNVLDKLSKTDAELLQKYSKVYFLSGHYVPDSLTELPAANLFDPTKAQQIHTKVWPNLQRLLFDAASAGYPLEIVSAYRSFDTQSSLKSGYKVVYGSGANQFSADQGYSEHQLGTTVDFSTPELKGALDGRFAKTNAFAWLKSNAHRYGFTLSYPENNIYYEYEPWHWRFVGVSLAGRLQGAGQHFYDLSQRAIDEYLVSIFD